MGISTLSMILKSKLSSGQGFRLPAEEELGYTWSSLQAVFVEFRVEGAEILLRALGLGSISLYLNANGCWPVPSVEISTPKISQYLESFETFATSS